MNHKYNPRRLTAGSAAVTVILCPNCQGTGLKVVQGNLAFCASCHGGKVQFSDYIQGSLTDAVKLQVQIVNTLGRMLV